MPAHRGKRSTAARRQRQNRYYTPKPLELDEPRWAIPVDERCGVCETAGRLTTDGRPKMHGGSWRGASHRVPPSPRTGGCEVCKGTGRISLPDDQRRDPYDDVAGAQARILRRRENDEHNEAA
jgi:hypothetical protein